MVDAATAAAMLNSPMMNPVMANAILNGAQTPTNSSNSSSNTAATNQLLAQAAVAAAQSVHQPYANAPFPNMLGTMANNCTNAQLLQNFVNGGMQQGGGILPNAFEGIPIYLVPGATGLPIIHSKSAEMKVNWATQPGNSAAGQEAYVDDDAGPKVDTSKHFHIFVGDLSPDVDSRMLREAFTPFGEVSEAKVIREFSPDAKLMPQPVVGKSKGYGFVAFPKKEEAERAIEQMNGAWLGRRAIRTNWATRRGANASQRTLNFDEVYNQTSQNNSSVYIGNLSVNVSEDDLRHMFSKFGNIQEIRNFKNQGYAFVRFDSKEAACHAICNNNNAELDGQVIRCSWGRANDSAGAAGAGAQAGSAGAYGYGYGYGGQPGAAGYAQGGGGGAPAGGMANAAQAQQQYQQYWNQYYQYYNNPAMMQQWQK